MRSLSAVMKRLLFRWRAFCAPILVILLMESSADAQNLVWAKRAGGNNFEYGNAIAVDGSGNSYITGYFQTGAVFGPGEANQVTLTASGASDIYTAKYGPNGAFAWVRKVGGSGADIGYGIAADSAGNSYVTGYFRGVAVFGSGEPNQTTLTVTGGADIFIAKYDTNGALVWAKKAGGSGGTFALEQGNAIAVDNLGAVYVTGVFEGTATFGLGEPNQTILTAAFSLSNDVFVAKYSSAGTLQWAKRAGGTNNMLATLTTSTGIAVDNSGNSYATGAFQSPTVFGPGETNQTILTPPGSFTSDIFIAKYDTNGALQWVKQAGGTGTDTGNGITVGGGANVYVTGAFQGSSTFGPGETNQTILTATGSSDLFVAKYDSSGLLQWVKQAIGTGIDSGNGIAVDGSGNIYAAGVFQLSATFGQGEANETVLTATGVEDIFVASYTSGGALRWSRKAGGSLSDGAIRIAVDTSGGSYVTGIFTGTATFGEGEANQTNLVAGGSATEIFVAKFAGSGAGGPILVNCPADSLQTAVNLAAPGSTIMVSGTCSENLLVRNEKQRITIDGGGTAAINAPSAGSPALNVRGKGILIQNFIIVGGSVGVHINRGSNAVLNSNVVQNSAGNGVMVDGLAFAVLTNNTIQNNSGAGVFVSENSTARIGFNSDSETVASTNTITGNGVGVLISNGSSARVVGNFIINNTGDGVGVLRDAHADIASNAINGNGGDGIFVSENSIVQLGEDSGTSIYESANTTAGANTGVGIRCINGGIADGRQGTLSGSGGAKNFGDSTCIDSLN
jgi:hypothetical protein